MGKTYRYFGKVFDMTDPHDAFFKDEERVIRCIHQGKLCKAYTERLGKIDKGDELYRVFINGQVGPLVTEPSCDWCNYDLLRGDDSMICPDCGAKFELTFKVDTSDGQ